VLWGVRLGLVLVLVKREGGKVERFGEGLAVLVVAWVRAAVLRWDLAFAARPRRGETVRRRSLMVVVVVTVVSSTGWRSGGVSGQLNKICT
jgi:hypothetical protein